jgi:senataxin
MLHEQYRMHPSISQWPSAFFYDAQLIDAPQVCGGEREAAFHSHACFPPLCFWDLRDGKERGGDAGGAGASLSNTLEADLACHLFTGWCRKWKPHLRWTFAHLLTALSLPTCALAHADMGF